MEYLMIKSKNLGSYLLPLLSTVHRRQNWMNFGEIQKTNKYVQIGNKL